MIEDEPRDGFKAVAADALWNFVYVTIVVAAILGSIAFWTWLLGSLFGAIARWF